MELKNQIAKIEGSNLYQLKGQQLSDNAIKMKLSSDEEFYSSKMVANWRARNTNKHRERYIGSFLSICKGVLKLQGKGNKERLVKLDFNCHPDSWMHPQDTERCISAIKTALGIDELQYNRRMVLRYALQYGMKVVLSEAESESLGISGKTEESSLGDLHMTREQYEKIIAKLSATPSKLAKFGFDYHSFCRPSIRFTVKIDDLKFYDRTVRFFETKKGKKITDSDILDELENDGKNVQTLTHRACMFTVFEHKTQKSYPKYINDERCVLALEKFAESRRHQGFKYLFWDDNKTIFEFKNYEKITKAQQKKDNTFYVDLFFNDDIGFKSGDFGKLDRGNYALRHFGVQMWLMATGYDYGKIKVMGWEDINTLIKWYGQRPAAQLAKEFGEILF